MHLFSLDFFNKITKSVSSYYSGIFPEWKMALKIMIIHSTSSASKSLKNSYSIPSGRSSLPSFIANASSQFFGQTWWTSSRF